MLRKVVATCLVMCAAATVHAGDVYLDFANFGARMNDLAASAGITPFAPTELTQIRNNIQTGLATSYRGFTGFTFTQTDPGGSRPVINFGLTAGAGSLGVADHIDFLNLAPNDTARVFSGNFGFTVNEFSGSTDRADQISQLSADAQSRRVCNKLDDLISFCLDAHMIK